MKYKLYDKNGNETNELYEAYFAFCPTEDAGKQFIEVRKNEDIHVRKVKNLIGLYCWNDEEWEWDKIPDRLLMTILEQFHNPCVV